MIRNATPEDATAVARIYNHYVETSIATFDTEPKVPAYFEQRIAEVQAAHPWVVFEGNDENILGYAYGVQLKAQSSVQQIVRDFCLRAPRALWQRYRQVAVSGPHWQAQDTGRACHHWWCFIAQRSQCAIA